MSRGHLSYNQREEARRYENLRRLFEEILTRFSRLEVALSRWDNDIKAELENLRSAIRNGNMRDMSRIALALAQLERELQQRQTLRQERKQRLMHDIHTFNRKLRLARQNLHLFRYDLERIVDKLNQVEQRIEQYNLAQTDLWHELRNDIQSLNRQLEYLASKNNLMQDLASVQVESNFAALTDEQDDQIERPNWRRFTSQLAPRETELSADIARRLKEIKHFLSYHEYQRLRSLTDSKELLERLTELERQRDELRAQASLLLDLYGKYSLFQPWLRQLERALQDKDWKQLRHLVPYLRQILKQPRIGNGFMFEVYMREHLPHYQIHWQHPGQTLQVQGNEAPIAASIDSQDAQIHFEPQGEAPQFCIDIANFASKVGWTWHEDQRPRHRARARTR
ncbi:MAG: hypothetical protein GXO54_06045 [Chloroflexi bacterium]|nr:hypothetical protein [Chloroflexota bacterium]